MCISPYSFKGQIEGATKWMLGRICFPSISPQLCIPTGKHDVVIIFHADQKITTDDHLIYDGIMKHLASHGYIVLSAARYFGTTQDGPWINAKQPEQKYGLIQSHISWLYEQSIAKLNITNNVAVIMHSAGGRFLETLGSVTQAGRVLAAIITFTPAFKFSEVPEYKLDFKTKAYLGLHTTPDEDPASMHVLGNHPKMINNSGFALYDSLEETIGFAKDFVFFTPPFPIVPGYQGQHYYQNNLVAKAYTTAFLGFHVKGIGQYADIFRLGSPAGTLKIQEPLWSVRQQHGHIDAPNFHRLCEFRLPGSFSILTTSGVIERKVGQGFTLNAWCPHVSHVAWFRFNQPVFRIIISLPAAAILTAYKYLSFRMGQVYDADLKLSANKPVQVKVGLNSQISSQGLTLPGQEISQVLDDREFKSAMQTFVIPMSSFQGANLGAIKMVYFDVAASSKTGAIIIASIEAWK